MNDQLKQIRSSACLICLLRLPMRDWQSCGYYKEIEMPNEKHFHGQSHSRGGFDIDEATISPDAKYWKSGAIGALQRLIDIVGDLKANELVDRFWDEENTWKEICEKTEAALDEARKEEQTQQAAADWLDEVSEPDPEREWQEVLEIAEMFGCEFLFESVQLPQSTNAPFPQDAELKGYEYHLKHGFTEQERVQLHKEYNALFIHEKKGE